MAQKQYRLNLNAAAFPILCGQIGRTAIQNPGNTSFVQPAAFSGDEYEKNLGIPQVLSVDNCLPSSRGFQSVFPVPDINSPYICYGHYFNQPAFQAIPVSVSGSGATRLFYFFHEDVVNLWDVTSGFINFWKPSLSNTYAGRKEFFVTYATIRGQTFFCIPHHATMYPRYLPEGGMDIEIAPMEGLLHNVINGICAGVNYLIAYDDDTIYWSDPSSAMTFMPALGSAGSTKLLALRGPIVACFSTPDGFMIYSTENVIAAIATGQPSQPFVFKEVPDGCGIQHPQNVGWENSSGTHYVFSKRGLQAVTKTKAQSILPEVSDALLQNLRQTLVFDHLVDDSYNQSNVMYVATEADMPELAVDEFPNIRVAFVASRYVCISYWDEIIKNGQQQDKADPQGSSSGLCEFNATIVYDITLGRFGRLVFPHTQVLSVPEITADNSPVWFDMFEASNFTDADTWYYDSQKSRAREDAWQDYNSIEDVLHAAQSTIYMVAPWGAIVKWATDVRQMVSDNVKVINTHSNFQPSYNNLFTWQPKVVVGRINLTTDRALSIYDVVVEGKFINLHDGNQDFQVSQAMIEVFDFKQFPTKGSPKVFSNSVTNVHDTSTRESFRKQMRVVAYDPIVVISGCFNISSICVTAAPGGKR